MWTSLVVQWIRICLPKQGTQVRSLVWEGSHMPQGNQAHAPRSLCSATKEATAERALCTKTKNRSHLLQLGKVRATTNTQHSQKTKKKLFKKKTYMGLPWWSSG